MKRILNCVIVVALSVGLAACANTQTIGRTTSLPASEKEDGVAIHLDAQQRLVLVRPGGKYCAEPSPDALAAYASSLGLGISAPGQGAASVASALQSSAGSIGLRTQSITLMRDTLYRMCEAESNGTIGRVQAAALLGRSQDLTAVVLAIEQLTGAVAASQVTLTGTAGANASASLLSNQKLLDAARKDEQEKKTSLEAAQKERTAAKQSVDDKQTEVKTAEEAYNKATAAGSNAGEPERKKLKDDLGTKNEELAKSKTKLEEAETKVQTKQELLDESKKNREAIEDLKDSAMTSAAANTTGAGLFSTTVQRNQLSVKATEHIAIAVRGMVEKVLDKDYSQDACVAFLTQKPDDPSVLSLKKDNVPDNVQDLCLKLINASIKAATTRKEAEIAAEIKEARIESLRKEVIIESLRNEAERLRKK